MLCETPFMTRKSAAEVFRNEKYQVSEGYKLWLYVLKIKRDPLNLNNVYCNQLFELGGRKIKKECKNRHPVSLLPWIWLRKHLSRDS